MSFLVPSRTILLISDDALFIFSNGARGVKMVDAVPWNVDNFEENVAVILAKECGGKPIMIINDMVEQHYRKEKLPKVSMLDKQNVLQRKLNVAFPNYPVRAALPLKEKVAKKAKGTVGVGGVYIFAAIPNSDAFTKTMDAARRSLAPIAGFGLLPVEASDMLKKLSEKLTPKGQKKSKWTVFIGQHRGGGLRQIVTKDGELALTRMTPIGNLDADPLKWATEVFQEFKATMSYLSRFGLDVADGLDVILIANAAAGEMVEKMIETPCNFYALTSENAAEALKISMGQQEDDCLADALHVSWIGRKNALILPMKAKEIDKVSKPRQMAMLASVVLVLGAGLQGYQLMDYMQAMTTTWDDIETQERRISELDTKLQKEVKRKEDLGFDIQLIQSSLTVQDEFEKTQIRALDLFYNIRRGLGRNLRIDRIEIRRGEVVAIDPFANPEDQKVPQFIATMQMTFPSTMDAKKGNKEVQDLQGVLQTILSDHTVKVTKFLEDYEYSEAMVVETGDTDQKSASQDYVAEIQIQGPML